MIVYRYFCGYYPSKTERKQHETESGRCPQRLPLLLRHRRAMPAMQGMPARAGSEVSPETAQRRKAHNLHRRLALHRLATGERRLLPLPLRHAQAVRPRNVAAVRRSARQADERTTKESAKLLLMPQLLLQQPEGRPTHQSRRTAEDCCRVPTVVPEHTPRVRQLRRSLRMVVNARLPEAMLFIENQQLMSLFQFV